MIGYGGFSHTTSVRFISSLFSPITAFTLSELCLGKVFVGSLDLVKYGRSASVIDTDQLVSTIRGKLLKGKLVCLS